MRLTKNIVPIMLLSGISCHAQQAEQDSSMHCQQLLINQQSIPSKLVEFLGEWESCVLNRHEEVEYGTNALITVSWPSVKMTVEYLAPEAAIFIVQVTGTNSLTSDWYETNKIELVDEFFDMNWNFDEFPGPTSEHYISADEGSNGQIWVERDPSGNVTWMRFSYAL